MIKLAVITVFIALFLPYAGAQASDIAVDPNCEPLVLGAINRVRFQTMAENFLAANGRAILSASPNAIRLAATRRFVNATYSMVEAIPQEALAWEIERSIDRFMAERGSLPALSPEGAPQTVDELVMNFSLRGRILLLDAWKAIMKPAQDYWDFGTANHQAFPRNLLDAALWERFSLLVARGHWQAHGSLETRDAYRIAFQYRDFVTNNALLARNLMPNLFSAARVEPRNGSETTEVLRAFRNGDRPEQRSGQYLFPERGVTWVPDDLAAPATSIVYYTDPSHLEILRRQLGEARFREVMRSMDPEKAAREALEEQRLRIRNLEPHEFSEMIQRLHSTITAIPLDMKIPSEIMGLVLELLRKIGLYGSDINEYFALNRVRFPELGQSEVQITGIGVEVITGNVMRWRSGESGETTSILLMLRENMNAVMMDLPLDPFTGITFHIDFVSYLQRIFGEDRIVYRYEPRPLTSQYRQVWRDPGSGQDREIIHYPLRIRVLPDGTYRIFNSYSGRGETSGNWQMP